MKFILSLLSTGMPFCAFSHPVKSSITQEKLSDFSNNPCQGNGNLKSGFIGRSFIGLMEEKINDAGFVSSTQLI